MKKWFFPILLLHLGLIMLMGMASAADMGRKEFYLSGGKKGPVFFPHQEHQKYTGDCMECHDLFPKKQGALTAEINAGDLAPKQVMNKKCVKCHRSLKKTGKPFGPTSCSKCHQKP